MRKNMILSLFLVSTVFVTPASANYFHYTAMNVTSNIGSAPNPTTRDIRENRILAQTHVAKPPVIAQTSKTRSPG